MIYEVTDNRITIDGYFFEMDTENTIHIYGMGMKYLDKIEIGKPLSFEAFEQYCNKFLENK